MLESKLGALDQGGDSKELLRVISQISGSNFQSIQRLKSEFGKTNNMYSGSFDDFTASQLNNNGQSQNQPSPYTEGQTATGPNGQKIKYTNGEWVSI